MLQGTLGDARVRPTVHVVEEARDIPLDYYSTTDKWEEVEIQLGRRSGKFEVRLFSASNMKIKIKIAVLA